MKILFKNFLQYIIGNIMVAIEQNVFYIVNSSHSSCWIDYCTKCNGDGYEKHRQMLNFLQNRRNLKRLNLLNGLRIQTHDE